MAFEQTLPGVEPATEPAPESPPPDGRAPWGYADIAMGIGVIIGALILLAPVAVAVQAVAGGDLNGDESETGIGMGVGFVLEAVLFLTAAFFSVRKYRLPLSALGLRRPKRGGYLFPVPLFFAAMIIIAVNSQIVSALGGDLEGNIPDETFDSTALIIMLGVLSLAMAPFVEETFFRGFVFGGLRGRWGVLGGALASGGLFALAHFTGVSGLALLPGIGAIGMMFALSYYYTGSLFAPIVAHFTFNLVSFLFGVLGVLD